jgi:hypothetical protein
MDKLLYILRLIAWLIHALLSCPPNGDLTKPPDVGSDVQK